MTIKLPVGEAVGQLCTIEQSKAGFSPALDWRVVSELCNKLKIKDQSWKKPWKPGLLLNLILE
jgi:hypothetical protein